MPEASRAAKAKRRSSPTLSQERIVTTALEVLDEHGIDGLSLRKVAAALDAGVNSLYWHVNSKDDLLALLADEVLSKLRLPTPTGDWHADCRLAMTELRTLLLRHPHAVGIVVTRLPTGPAALRSSEWILQVLYDAGFRGVGIQHVHATLLTYTFGKVTQEVAWRERLSAAAAGLPAAAVPAAGDAIDAEAFPRTLELLALFLDADRTAGFDADRETEFLAGLDAILTGFASAG